MRRRGAEQLIADARRAVQEQAALDRLRPLSADLQQIIHALPSAASAAGAPTGDQDAGEQAAPGDEEVIDAEFTRE